MRTDSITVTELRDEAGTPLDAANPNQRVRMRVPTGAAPLDMLRREV